MAHSDAHDRRDPKSSVQPERPGAPSSSPSVHPTPPSTEENGAPATAPQDQQRHLHHNSGGKQAQQHPDAPAGQHATGSFTNEKKSGK